MKQLMIIILMGLLLTACNNQKAEEPVALPVNENLITLTDTQIKNANIEIGKIEQKQISSILKVNGRIDVPPQNMISVSVPFNTRDRRWFISLFIYYYYDNISSHRSF